MSGFSLTDLSLKLAEAFDHAGGAEVVLGDGEGRPAAVLVPYDEWRAIKQKADRAGAPAPFRSSNLSEFSPAHGDF